MTVVQKVRGYSIPPSMQDIPVLPKKQRNDLAHKIYLESDVWKCPKSPTGAHHWRGTVLLMKCIHCGEERIPTRGFESYYSPRKLQEENRKKGGN